MIYNNRNYPHPVLGILDDFENSSLTVELKVSSNPQTIEISPVFILKDRDLVSLINKKKASYISHVYCRGTLFREVYKSTKSISDPIRISATKLNGEVEVDFFITAEVDQSNYHSSSFNSDYSNLSFKLDKADIVGYAGKGKFYANKLPEELKSISALMNIDNSGKKGKKAMYLEYEGQKITIMLCDEDYKNYKVIKGNTQHIGIILSSIVLPALIEALYFLNDPTSDNYKANAWHKALREIKEESKDPSPFAIAQNILDKPVNKCLNLLTIADEYE